MLKHVVVGTRLASQHKYQRKGRQIELYAGDLETSLNLRPQNAEVTVIFPKGAGVRGAPEPASASC